MKKIISSVLLAASLNFAVEVGVLAPFNAYNPCPSGYIIDMFIYLDTEDTRNNTRILPGGDGNPPAIAINNKKNLRMHFCRVDSRDLRPVPYDYVVFRLDEECPSGAIKFRRHHDTEDKNNENGCSANIAPSVVNKNADLEFCFVPATPGATADFPLSGRGGVFANFKNATTIANSTLHVDDEDNDNEDSYEWYETNDYDIRTRIKRIVEEVDEKNNGHKDTRYHVSWRMASLAKSAAAEAPVVAGNVAADKPVAAELKGFDHSSVSFELKSAGNAKITIANLNGAVVAKVSKENLQPGVHSVEWHSGIVPNGRYVVTIEHNGKVSGKNVILK